MKDFILGSYIDSSEEKNFLSELSSLGYDVKEKYARKNLRGEYVSYEILLGKESKFSGYRNLEYRKEFTNSSSILNLIKTVDLKFGKIRLFTEGHAGLATEKEFEEIKKYLEKHLNFRYLKRNFYAGAIEVFLSPCFGNDKEIYVEVLISYFPHIDPQEKILEANAYVSSLLSLKNEKRDFKKLPIAYKRVRNMEKTLYMSSCWMMLNDYDETEDSFREKVENFEKVVHAIELKKSRVCGCYIDREFTIGIKGRNFVPLGISGFDSSSSRTCRWRIYEDRWLDSLPKEKVMVVVYDALRKKQLGIISGLDERKICILEKENFNEILHFPYLKGFYPAKQPFYFKSTL